VTDFDQLVHDPDLILQVLLVEQHCLALFVLQEALKSLGVLENEFALPRHGLFEGLLDLGGVELLVDLHEVFLGDLQVFNSWTGVGLYWENTSGNGSFR